MSAPKPDGGGGASARDSAPETRPGKCALCGKPQEAKFRPFCSKRCADIDLGRWLKGSYAIPAEEPPDFGAGEGGEGLESGQSAAGQGGEPLLKSPSSRGKPR
jgi:uncharacterized protein